MTDTPDPAAIARGLTKAQRRVLTEIASLKGNYRCVLNYQPPQILENKGMVDMSKVAHGMATYTCLPLGQAVLAALDAETRHDR